MESKKRSMAKTIIWRIIGVIWTWFGAYAIMSCVADKYKTATFIASILTFYHHTTRIIMYYFYERIWNTIKWGKC